MRIDPDVIEVLYNLQINEDTVRITGQLDRKLYVKVDKVLRACGGKWNRYAKAHLFEGDAHERLDAAIITGEVTTARDTGFFETPAVLAKQLVELAGVQPGHVVLEPSAGTGRIVDAIRAVGAQYVFCERDPHMRSRLVARGDALRLYDVDDFLEAPIETSAAKVDRVVMNPPFCKVGGGDHLDHVRHAYQMLTIDGVLTSVLPASVWFRTDRRHTEFRRWVADQYGYFVDLPEGSFKESGTMVRTCVLRIEN